MMELPGTPRYGQPGTPRGSQRLSGTPRRLPGVDSQGLPGANRDSQRVLPGVDSQGLLEANKDSQRLLPGVESQELLEAPRDSQEAPRGGKPGTFMGSQGLQEVSQWWKARDFQGLPGTARRLPGVDSQGLPEANRDS